MEILYDAIALSVSKPTTTFPYLDAIQEYLWDYEGCQQLCYIQDFSFSYLVFK